MCVCVSVFGGEGVKIGKNSQKLCAFHNFLSLTTRVKQSKSSTHSNCVSGSVVSECVEIEHKLRAFII